VCQVGYLQRLIILICNFNYSVTLAKPQVYHLSEDDADALKHVAVLTVYKILLIYIYIQV
jgi:hypothetical protein